MATKKRFWAIVVAALSASVILAGSSLTVTGSVTPANAWSAMDFKAGNIVDDGLFYNGAGMTTAEVQSFLNKRVPECWLGRPGYEVGKPVTWNGPTKLASKCTRDYTVTTASRPANAYCKAYTGAPNEKAAAIIAKVGAACGISPRVLLVMLEKEQSLITDPWPNENQYFMAMGYACPDSGPGGTAACDPKQGGFFQQVYRAAWQLQVYRAFSDSYNYKPLKKNFIQWHPKQSCGGSNVYIENWATAALYIYTPYQPNQAALRAGSGTGDACSSYGNRNFFILWNTWFGSTVIDDQMSPGIRQVYDQALASGFNYGNPLGARVTVTKNGGGFQMEFENGIITESKLLGKSFGILRGWMMDAYLAAGGASGSWGFLASGISGVAANGNYRASFQHGTTVYDPKNVVMRYMPTLVFNAWKARGEQKGPLGFPSKDATLHSSTAASQLFQGGTLMVSRNGTAVLDAAELKTWTALGGYPVVGLANADRTPFAGKSYRRTEKGGMVQTSASAQVFVPAGIFERFVSSESTVQTWGWPVSAITVSGGAAMKFQKGNAVYSSSTGVAAFMQTATFDKWVASGGPKGATGFPVKDTVVVDGQGTYQVFARQTVYYGPYGKPLAFSPSVYLSAYEKSGGPTGPWGWPAGPGFAVGSGKAVPFQKGNAVYSSSTGVAAFMQTATFDKWVASGGPKGATGFPVKDTVVVDGQGTYQVFARQTVYYGPYGKPLAFSPSVYLSAYEKSGGPTGPWGWPAGPGFAVGSGKAVPFQKGNAVYSSSTGVAAFMQTATFDKWVASGGPKGATGFPVKDTVVVDGQGTYQVFARQTVYYGPYGKPLAFSPSVYLSAYEKSGGPTGPWGWPAGPGFAVGSGKAVPFQNGNAVLTPPSPVVFVPKPTAAKAEVEPSPDPVEALPPESTEVSPPEQPAAEEPATEQD